MTIVALLNASAGGNITFTINGFDYDVGVFDGRAVLSVDPGLDAGVWEVVALYSGDNVYYGQRNTTSFTVKVKSPATISVIAPESGVNNTVLSISAKLNFIAPTELQLVVRLFHFSCNTLSVGLF